MAYKDGNWTFPGELIAAFNTTAWQLAARFSGVLGTYPRTASGDVVIFDGSTGKNESFNPTPNQGHHLGLVSPATADADSTWRWQASPWGSWDVVAYPAVLDGHNVTLHNITQATMDGRFGANDTAINYAGSYAMVLDHTLIYGFFGEFWKDAEVGSFLLLLLF